MYILYLLIIAVSHICSLVLIQLDPLLPGTVTWHRYRYGVHLNISSGNIVFQLLGVH
jgi:hypothetical protein